MRDLKEYEKLAGLDENKKPDQKKLLQFKKKLLTIIKKKGLLQASEYIKDVAKDHGDEYIDPLISYVKFAEAQAVEAIENDLLFEEDGQKKLDENKDPYQARKWAGEALRNLARDVDDTWLSGADPDSDRYSRQVSTKYYNAFMKIVDGVGRLRQQWNKIS